MPLLRRLLLDRIITTLSLVLGAAQALLGHWVAVVALGGAGPRPATALALTAALVAANGAVAPPLTRWRRRADLRGRVARAYLGLGVATLLLGTAVALCWVAFLLPSGLLGLLGAGAEGPYAVFRVASVAVLGALALCLGWGFTRGQARVELTHLRREIPGLAEELSGLRIVQISDLHIGNGLEGVRLERMLERVNALEPDVIAVTGDIFDFDPSCVEEGARRLGALRARYGVYAILGNHDQHTGAERIAAALARHAPGISLLRDEVVRLPLPAPLYLAGVEDPGRDWHASRVELAGLTAVAAARPEDGPTLLLVHRPQAFPQAARLGFPLVLAGHTHGGQLALPTRGGQHNLSRVMTRRTRGLYLSGQSALYVNRGLGVGGPALRLNCPREITTLELASPRSGRAASRQASEGRSPSATD